MVISLQRGDIDVSPSHEIWTLFFNFARCILRLTHLFGNINGIWKTYDTLLTFDQTMSLRCSVVTLVHLPLMLFQHFVSMFASKRSTTHVFRLLQYWYDAPCVRLLTLGRSFDSDSAYLLMHVATKHKSNPTVPICSSSSERGLCFSSALINTCDMGGRVGL